MSAARIERSSIYDDVVMDLYFTLMVHGALKFGRARGVLNADQVRVHTLLDRVIKRPNKRLLD